VGSPCAVVDGSFEAELPLTYEAFRYGVHPLPAGDHDVTVSVTSSDGRCDDVPLRLSPPLAEAVPLQVRTDVHEGRLVRGPSGMLRLTLVRPVGEARGRYQRQRLLEDVRRRPRRLHRSLLIRSYFGEHATDSGVAVQQELRRRGSDLPVYWAVQDHSVPVPAGGHPVVVNTREWFERLASATYYLDNMYQPDYHVKPDGQVIVQTFHGYPFKAMGLPHWRKQQFSQERIDAYLRRSAEWDYLVSPARYATPLLRSDFGYQGATLEIGYPRNDVLLSSDSEEVRAVTRRCLGLADDQTAVLYAPTFRDYLAHDDNRARMADLFDIEAAAAALGEGFVILVRGHAFNARTRERVRVRANTVDVTDYPEVSDLHLAADVAVVDYSSLRFDFGVTGKPMVFHVPDLQRYQETRGWLFDFEPTAPGPLVQSTEEVVAALRDLDDVRSRHAEQYAEFRATYLDLEDGHAASRLVDAVFAPRGDA
jgi:CDP-glycerol glycerophosphotransferase